MEDGLQRKAVHPVERRKVNASADALFQFQNWPPLPEPTEKIDVNINIQVHPGYEHVITLTPTAAGEFSIICNEFCGIGHHTMTGKIYVTDAKQAQADQRLTEGR
jgi:hypothetical protein